MTAIVPTRAPTAIRHRPKTLTVFAAAFIAGAVVAVGVNRALDVHLAQSKPQVECEPIFVALRSLPQGSPVTVWDVALRDWPKAMVPSTALKSHDTFEGHLLRHPLREGQPLLSVQLIRVAASSKTNATDPSVIEQPFAPPAPAPAVKAVADVGDSWLPGPAAGVIAVTERPARIAVSPPPEAAEPVAQPATITRDTPPPVETSKPADPVTATPTVADAVEPPPQPLSTVEPQPMPKPQAVPRTDVPDAAVVATPPSPELVPYPTTTAVTPQTEPLQPTAVTPVEPAAAPLPTSSSSVIPTPAQTDAPEPATSAAATAPASTPSPVDLPADATVATQPAAELRTVLAQNPTPAAPAETQTSRQPGDSPHRYLVVPERIALQADVSFVNPKPQGSVSEEPAASQPQPASQQPSRQSPQTLQPQQQKPTVSGRLLGRSGPAVRAPGAQRTSGGTTRQPSQPLQPPTGKRPASAATPTTMFPNIAAGIDALTGGFKRARDEQRAAPPR